MPLYDAPGGDWIDIVFGELSQALNPVVPVSRLIALTMSVRNCAKLIDAAVIPPGALGVRFIIP